MKENEGWALKNKYGTILLWTVSYKRKDVLSKTHRSLKTVRSNGGEIVKVRIIER